MVEPGSLGLDLGCGDGELLATLAREKRCEARGIEIDEQAIYKCVARGLSVLHGDIDTGLPEYGDKSFDYVILNQTFQQVKKPDVVLKEALRVGKQVIIGFPNFAHYSVRFQILIGGTVPVTPSLPYEWYNTPNLHFLSILDFERYCRRNGVCIKRAAYLTGERRVKFMPNLRALTGIFLLAKNGNDKQEVRG